MVTTNELIEVIKQADGKIFEATLVLEGSGRATHFIYGIRDEIIDEGIEKGSKDKITVDDFLAKYRGATWVINQVVGCFQ